MGYNIFRGAIRITPVLAAEPLMGSIYQDLKIVCDFKQNCISVKSSKNRSRKRIGKTQTSFKP